MAEKRANSWDRLPKESNKAYEAFCFYRDLPPGSRTVLKAEVLYRGKYSKKEQLKSNKRAAKKQANGRFNSWSSSNEWVERARDHDAYIEQKARAKTERDRINQIAKIKRKFSVVLEQSINSGLAIIAITQNKLEKMAEAISDDEKKEQDLTVNEIASFLRAANDTSANMIKLSQTLYPDDFNPKVSVEVQLKSELEKVLPKGVDPVLAMKQIQNIIIKAAANGASGDSNGDTG